MGVLPRIFFKSAGWLFVLLLGTVLVLGIIGVKLDLSHLRGGVEVAAGQALGRQVTIAGPVEVEFSNWPALQVSDVKIANVAGAAQADFLNAGLVRMRIGVFPLLRGDINIAEITAENVTLNLESDTRGRPNWVFDRPSAPEPGEAAKSESGGERKLITFTALDQLSLKQITVNYRDAALNKSLSFVLNTMQGTAAKGEPVLLHLAGKVQEREYDLELEGDPLTGLLDQDEPWAFELNGDVFGKDIDASGDMLVRNQEPEINLVLEVRDMDVGHILSELGLVKGMQASMGNVGMKVSINGDSLQEILQQSGFTFKVRDGNWKVTLPSSEASFDITGLSGDIRVEKGNNITMKLDGVIDKTPVKLLITGAPLVEYVTNQDEIPFSIDAEFAKSRLSFAGNLKLPVTDPDLTLALKVSSERIDHLNELLRLDLPPVGPVSLDSKLSVTSAGYELSKLAVQVGDSHLDGILKLSALQTRPKLEVSLISGLIQLNDFDTGKQKEAVEEPADGEVDTTDAEEDQPVSDRRNLLSYEVLNAFDADIKIEAQDVRSGEDSLGSALMQIGLRDARLVVEPLRLDVPGGGIQVNMDYTPTPTDVSFNIQAEIEEFDLGIMVRRAKPGTDMGGKFTLDAKLQSQAPDLASVMEHANGHFDFALVPENFSAGIIDLWAVNLLTAIMDKSTEKDESKINCVVVRFGMEDGLMEEKAIYLDTTNMRIAGKSKIDFKKRELEIKLAPKAKKPEFFSVAIPIQVKGSFDDFGLKIGVLRMGGQVVSFVTSPFHVPVRRVFTKEAPADGIEACKAAWTTTKSKGADLIDPIDSEAGL